MATTTTPRFGFTSWSADTDVPSPAEFTGNNQLADGLVGLTYIDVLANLVGYQPYPGTKFFATDTRQWFRSNGAAWLPLLGRVDTEVLSADLPSSAPDGTYFHTTDTDDIFRGTGASTELVEILTALPASFPVGTLAFLPVSSSFVTSTFYVQPSDNPPALPAGWAYCAGQSLTVSAYPALFALLGYTFTFTGWVLTFSGASVSFSSLPNLAQIQSGIASKGVTPVVDGFNPNLVVSPAWSLIPSGIASSGPTFNLPYGISRPMYAYTQSSYEAQEAAGNGLPSPLGWPSVASEPYPANPYLADGNPTGAFAVLIKTT